MIVKIIRYLFRYLGSKDTANVTCFDLQTLLILVAPALFAASVYMILGRLIIFVRAGAYSIIRPTWLTKIFIARDLLSFLVQLAGSGLLSSHFKQGKAVILVGLVAQLLSLFVFLANAALFHRRLARALTPMSLRLDTSNDRNGWRGVMIVLYTAGGLLFVRSMFRLIEFTGSSDSPPMKSEAYFYVCDSTLMVIFLLLLGWFHPSRYLGSHQEITDILEEMRQY